MKKRLTHQSKTFLLSICAVLVAGIAAPTWGDEDAHQHDHEAQNEQAVQSDATEEVKYLFGNHQCPVEGETVIPESFVESEIGEKNVYGKIFMCCDACKKDVEENFEDLYTKFYRTDKKTGKPKDPVDLNNPHCPMSGHPVEEDVSLEYNGMIIHFCCPGCGQDFLEEPNPKLVELISELKPYEYQRPAGSGTSK